MLSAIQRRESQKRVPECARCGQQGDRHTCRSKREFATYNEIAFHPLAHASTVKDIEGYPWPSVGWSDFSHLKEEIDGINRDERYCILFFAGGASGNCR